MTKAIVKNSVVINIIEYSDENSIIGIKIPSNSTLIECTDIPVRIGDVCTEESFYHNGVHLESESVTE